MPILIKMALEGWYTLFSAKHLHHLLAMQLSDVEKKTVVGDVRMGVSENGVCQTWLPSGKHTKTTIFNGKIHYKWPFSIAMFVYQRVFKK